MPRALRIEYPGAIYHVMNRGDRREPIFKDDNDRRTFMTTLGEACTKTDWQIHALCLMNNHFHMVVETPNGNLVAGMKWFLGTYTARFNRKHQLFGHLFSGRYKSILVDGSGSGYLRTVCDYVHLNPVRAHLLGAEQKLSEFRWSTYREYLKEPHTRPPWLRVDRLLGELGIPMDSEAGRREFEKHLENRRAAEAGENWDELRRGWCLGSDEFREELLLMAQTKAVENHHGSTRRESAEEKARRIMAEELGALGWTHEKLLQTAKGAPEKIKIAERLRTETSVTLKWIAEQLKMGTWTHVANRLYHSKKRPANEETQLGLV